MHREENVDVREHLVGLLDTLNLLCEKYDVPMIFSTHPRTREKLAGVSDLKLNPLIRFLKPFGFFDYVNLQMNAFCVISDSGTISEESSILSFPAITMRNALERPEALDSGNIILTGLHPETCMNAVELVNKEWENTKNHKIPAEYEITNTSYRVLKLIVGTAKLSHLWDSIVSD